VVPLQLLVTLLVGCRRGGSAIDARTTRHEGYAKSLHARPRIEPAFGWLKTIAWMRKVKLRGLAKVDWLFASRARPSISAGSSPSGPRRHERLVAAPRRALAQLAHARDVRLAQSQRRETEHRADHGTRVVDQFEKFVGRSPCIRCAMI
jgi:hypothetical protein